MLQTQTVNGDTLGLLKSLMATPILQQFDLVGGTNLSLRLGHRLSIDLDLFTTQPAKFQVILPPVSTSQVVFDWHSIDRHRGFYHHPHTHRVHD